MLNKMWTQNKNTDLKMYSIFYLPFANLGESAPLFKNATLTSCLLSQNHV